MGVCANKKSFNHSPKSLNQEKGLINAYGIKQFGNSFVPSVYTNANLNFEFKIFNIKSQSLADNKIIFADEKNKFMSSIVSGSNPKFNLEKYLALSIPFEKLESTYLEMYIYALPKSVDIFKFASIDDALENGTLYSGLKVDLLTIAIGPEHHDLSLISDKKRQSLGRLSFNVLCSHVEKINLTLKNLQCKVFHLVQNEVVMKLKFKESHNIVESDYTLPIIPNLYGKEEFSLYNWIAPEKEDDEGSLSFSLNLSINELRGSVAALNIYDVVLVEDEANKEGDKDSKINPTSKMSRRCSLYKKSLENKIKVNLIHKYTSIGYVNLNFYKILSENDNIITKQSSRFFQTFRIGNEVNTANNMQSLNSQVAPQIKFQIFDNITKTISEEVYYNGVSIGQIEGLISIINIPLIRQIMCGVHTERGFDISSVHLNFEAENKISLKEDTEPKELNILSNKTNNLLTLLLKGSNLTGLAWSSRDVNNGVLEIMKEIKSVLGKSYKESALYYNYLKDKDLYKAQNLMMTLGLNLLKVIESFDLDSRQIAFEILILINSRAEFDLGTVWKAWFANTPTIIRDSKLLTGKIIEDFISFNNLCLDFSLKKLTMGKSIDKESKVFVEEFLSIAYFRIPKFRKSFLQAIRTEEHKLSESSQNEEYIEIDPINSLILWENIFYKRLDEVIRSNESTDVSEINEKLKETEAILSHDPEWKERLSKRGLAFYSMVLKVEKYILSKVVKNMNITWYNIPGFDAIIEAVFAELRNKQINTYSASLVEVMTLFINDSEIMNKFAQIIIHKTNVFDTSAVFKVVKIIDTFFSNYEKKKSISDFNLRFNYNLLKRAFKVILENDHSLLVAKFLWLYYRNSHIMSFEHVAEVFLKLFEGRFFLIFFHWSWQVRNIFYFIILYTIDFRIRRMNFIESEGELTIKGIRRGGTTETQEIENYPEVLRKTLMLSLDERMKVIERVKVLVNEEHIDPSFNTKFRALNKPEFSIIPAEAAKNIAVGMLHFETIEKGFLKWSEDNKRKKESEIKYPSIDLEPPKDDVIQYTENW